MKKILVLILTMGIIFSNINIINNNEDEIRGVFVSYIELSEYVKNDSIEKSKENINKMINNIKELKLNTIILQVRITSDAIYDSKIFPYSYYVSSKEGIKTFDILNYFIKQAHNNNIKLYAWINPYRVRTTEDISTISKKNPAYQYLGTDTIYIKEGIYYNPSKKEVTNLIVEGVKEVLNYKIDGLLFDDYFYPDDNIDQIDYQKYIKENGYIDKKQYHLDIINNMVEQVHKECQNKKIKFGISPDGNIDNNYNKNYADVRKWLQSNKYVDFIMPQVYYGFYNSTKGYLNVIKEWEELLKNDNIDLLIALAFYKVGKEDNYAKEGKNEWLQNDNIIMREILLSRNLKNYRGFSLFRYDNIFVENNFTPNSINELDNMKKIIK